MVREGLGRLDGVRSVSERASNDTGTCVVLTDGKFLAPETVRKRLTAERIGARLRGIEAVVRGTVIMSNQKLLLNVPGWSELIPLKPLERKIQLEERHEKAAAITAEERSAYAQLSRHCRASPLQVEVIGPISESRRGFQLEVRRFDLKGAPPHFEVRELSLGIDVNGPYGIVEPWSIIRDALVRVPGILSVAETPNLKSSSGRIEVNSTQLPDLHEIETVIRRSGAGAQLRDVVVAIEGNVIAAPREMFLYGGQRIELARVEARSSEAGADSAADTLRKAVGRSVCVEGSLRQIRTGHYTLRAIKAEHTRPAVEHQVKSSAQQPQRLDPPEGLIALHNKMERKIHFQWPIHSPDIAGYHLYCSTGDHLGPRLNQHILTVRDFELEATVSSLEASYVITAVNQDGTESPPSEPVSPAAPDAPKNLVVHWTQRGRHLDWDDNSEPDFSSYNIFRALRAGGPLVQIAAGVTRSEYVDSSAPTEPIYVYAVTATDSSSNESEHSVEAIARKPRLRWFVLSKR